MNWFYSPDGSERFEVSEEVLLELIRSGKVTRDTLVWRDGMADWMTAGVANRAWFQPPPAEVAIPSPPLDLVPPQPFTEVTPPQAPAEMGPSPRGISPFPTPLADVPPPPPPAEVTPPPAEIVPIGAPTESDSALSIPQSAPPPPAYYPPAPPVQPRDSAAMSSVISGSIGLAVSVSGFCCCFGALIAPVAGVIAVVFGHMAYGKTQGYPEAERDKNMALVGLVLGYLTIALSVGSVMFQLLSVGLSAALQNHPFH